MWTRCSANRSDILMTALCLLRMGELSLHALSALVPNFQDLSPIQSHIHNRKSLDEDQKEALLKSLAFDQIESRHNTIEKAYGKPCEWLAKTPEYIDWFESPDKLAEHHGLLWIKGHPGAGKSTLMKSALHKAQKTNRGIFISFFFNARGDELEQSTIGMYRSLLFQLLEKLPRLQTAFSSLGRAARSGNIPQWSIESLKSLFENAVQNLEQSPLTCFIDALDECGVTQIRNMISFFEDVGEMAVALGISFRVCLSSRHYPHIAISKGLSLDLGQQHGHDQDIISYVKGKLSIGRDKGAEQIRTQLIEKSAGIFIWVVLVIGILQQEHDDGYTHMLEQRLKDIPGDLNDLFRDILTRDSRHQAELLLCIQWVLFARKPLRKEQLHVAILVGADPVAASHQNMDETGDADTTRFILSSSKGLVEANKSQRKQQVQFIHEPVREFFLRDGLRRIWPGLRRDFRGESHERPKQCCIEYMRIAERSVDFESGRPAFSVSDRWGWKWDVHGSMRKLCESMETKFPLLEYAFRTVLHHANEAARFGVDQESFLHSFDVAGWLKFEPIFEQHGRRVHLPTTSLLYFLAEYNAAKLIEVHPNKLCGFEVVEGEDQYGMPILAAVATNSRQAVYTLLKAQADAEPPTSPLHSLCEQYDQDINKRSGTGRAFAFSKGKGTFGNLVAAGDEQVVTFAMASARINHNIDWKGMDGASALCCALRGGLDTPVQVLLDKGARADVPDGTGLTALHCSARKGQESMVSLFLANRVNVDVHTTAGKTPLHYAAQEGHVAVVQMLLAGGAEFQRVTKFGGSVLHVAVEKGDEAVVRLLLDYGSDTEVVAKYHKSTPLLLAAENGHVAMVELLLARGADVDAVDEKRYTPLLYAAGRGHETAAQLLLDKGANIKAETIDRFSALYFAISRSHEAVIRLLLNYGADVEAVVAGYGMSSLHLAAQGESRAVVQVLLDHGANIHATDLAGNTSLHFATQRGSPDVGRLLYERGANMYATNHGGKTLLHLAASEGNKTIAQLLLDLGANIYATDHDDETPLHSVVRVSPYPTTGDLEPVTHLLLERGANIYASDSSGNTPLSLANSLPDSDARKTSTFQKLAEIETHEPDVEGLLWPSPPHGYVSDSENH